MPIRMPITRLYSDIKSTPRTPGVPVETDWAALPLTAVLASVCSNTPPPKSIRHSHYAYYVFFRCHPAVRMKCSCFQAHIYKHKQDRMQYVSPVLMFFDCKQSAKAARNRLTEMSSTFDASQWGCVIEAFFEDKERTIIKACCWNDRGIAAQDVCPDWKQIGFYCECHLRWSYLPGGTCGLWFLGMCERRWLSSIKSFPQLFGCLA